MATESEITLQAQKHDVQTAARNPLPLRIRLLDESGQPTLHYSVDDQVGANMSLQVTNQSGGDIYLPNRGSTAGPGAYHLAVSFRPGLLDPQQVAAIALAENEWDILPKTWPDRTTLYLLSTRSGARAINNGESLALSLLHLRADAARGSHNSNVVFQYKTSLQDNDDPDHQCNGQREQVLAVTGRSVTATDASRRSDLRASFQSANTMVNDGATDTKLELMLTNTSESREILLNQDTTLTVALDVALDVAPKEESSLPTQDGAQTDPQLTATLNSSQALFVPGSNGAFDYKNWTLDQLSGEFPAGLTTEQITSFMMANAINVPDLPAELHYQLSLPGGYLYTVEPGETLASAIHKLGVTMNELRNRLLIANGATLFALPDGAQFILKDLPEQPSFQVSKTMHDLYPAYARQASTLDSLINNPDSGEAVLQGVSLDDIVAANMPAGKAMQLPAGFRYTSKAGESLTDVAAHFGLAPADLLAANLRAGAAIDLPEGYQYRRLASQNLADIATLFGASQAGLLSANLSPGQALTPPDGYGYTVQAGETMGSIARKLDIYWADLVWARAKGGRALRLPADYRYTSQAQDDLTSVAGLFQIGLPAAKVANLYHSQGMPLPDGYRFRAKARETFSALARTLVTSEAKLKSANPNVSDPLTQDTDLKLPDDYYYLVQPGDTLQSLRNRFRADDASIDDASFTSNINLPAVVPGQQIRLPAEARFDASPYQNGPAAAAALGSEWERLAEANLAVQEGETLPLPLDYRYTVRDNEDLNGIAGRLGLANSEDLVLANADLLPAGRLRLPAGHNSYLVPARNNKALRTLEDTKDVEVSAVAITPDGEKIISGSSDSVVKVWDLASGQLLRTLSGHTAYVSAVAVTPDGAQVVSGSLDHTLRFWDANTGALLKTLGTPENLSHPRPEDEINAVAVTHDGGQIVCGTNGNTLKVWDLASGTLSQTLKGHTGPVGAVAVTPDGAQVVSGSFDKTLRVWDLASGSLLQTLSGHTSVVLAVAVTPDGAQVISGSADHTLKVWELASGSLLHTLEGHTGDVYGVAVTPDGTQVVSCSADHTLKVWDLASGRLLRTLEGHKLSVSAIAVTPDGRQVASGSNDSTLKVWDMASSQTPEEASQILDLSLEEIFAAGFAGKALRLPAGATYPVRQGDTLKRIVNTIGGDQAGWIAANFKAGQQITLPQGAKLKPADAFYFAGSGNLVGLSLDDLINFNLMVAGKRYDLNNEQMGTLRLSGIQPDETLAGLASRYGVDLKEFVMGNTSALVALKLGEFGPLRMPDGFNETAWNKYFEKAAAQRIDWVPRGGADQGKSEPGMARWVLGLPEARTAVLAPDDSITLTLNGLMTSQPTGLANLYLEYSNFGHVPDGRLVLPVQKSPVQFKSELASGSNIVSFPGSTSVAGDLTVSQTLTADSAQIDQTLTAGQVKASGLSVTDDAKIDQTLTAGQVNASGLSVTGDAKIDQTLTADQVTASGLSVTGDAKITGELTVKGNNSNDFALVIQDSSSRRLVTVGKDGEFSVRNPDSDTTIFKVSENGVVNSVFHHRMYPEYPVKIYEDIYEAMNATGWSITNINDKNFDNTEYAGTKKWHGRNLIKFGNTYDDDQNGASVFIPSSGMLVWIRICADRDYIVEAVVNGESYGVYGGGFRPLNPYCPDGSLNSLNDGYATGGQNMHQWLAIPNLPDGTVQLRPRKGTKDGFWLSGLAFTFNPWNHAVQSALGFWGGDDKEAKDIMNKGDYVPYESSNSKNDVLGQLDKNKTYKLSVPVVDSGRDKLLYLVEYNDDWQGVAHMSIKVENTPIERFLSTYDNPFARHWNLKINDRYIAARIPANLTQGKRFLTVELDLTNTGDLQYREIGTHDLQVPIK